MQPWMLVAAGMGAVLVLFLIAVLSRPRALTYAGPPDRDLRLELLRGAALVIGVTADPTVGGTADESAVRPLLILGVALFVVSSGANIGMQYRPAVASGGAGEVVVRALARAWQIYVVAFVASVAALLLSLLPFVRTDVLSPLPGAAGGTRSPVFASAGGLLRYPVEPAAVLDLVLLRTAPWQVGMLGLFVVLLAAAPLLLWMLSRRGWALALLLSAGLYIFGGFTGVQLLPTGFEDDFPLLAWQVLFVVGLIAGYYRRELIEWFGGRTGRAVLLPLALLAVAGVALSFGFGGTTITGTRTNAALDAVAGALFAGWYRGSLLDPGPLLTVVVVAVASYALLTAYWKPISAALGWLLLPLGRSPLLVVVLQLFLVLLVANVLRDDAQSWMDVLMRLVVLALVWAAALYRTTSRRGRHA